MFSAMFLAYSEAVKVIPAYRFTEKKKRKSHRPEWRQQKKKQDGIKSVEE